VDRIYRTSTTFNLDGLDFQFNQFLIDDERPALIHTGMYGSMRMSATPCQRCWILAGSGT
jgi:hypothetical protein